MSFGHGKDSRIYANGTDVSAFFKGYSLDLSRDLAVTTTMGKASETRIAGLRDAKASANGFFDGAAGAVNAVLHTVFKQAADVIVSLWFLGETAVGSFGYAMRARLLDYGVDAPVTNVVATSASLQGDDSVERVVSIHPLAAETATGNSASLDNGAGTSAGAAFYVQCTAATAPTSLVIVIQHSTDNASWSTLATHTTITAANTTERISVAGTVNRYTRTSFTITGTSFTFSEAICRN